YYCFCTQERLDALRKEQQAQKLPPKYDKLCLKLSEEEVRQKIAKGEPHVIRLNVPSDKQISFTDLVHGEISVSGADLDDQVLVKSDGFPTYHLAVVVDDHLMNITHVLRGDEWVVSTPKHILLYSAFGWEPPKFAHLPLLLSKSRKKLGKREGDVAVKDFLEKGYLPEALLNFVALLGWNPKTEEEIFNLRELIDQFSLDKLNKAGAVFDLEKLDWLNGVYIRKLGISELTARTLPFLKKAGIDFENYPQNFIQKLLSLEQERLKKLSEIGERVQYFFRQPEYEAELLVWKKSTKDATLKNLQELAVFFETLEFKGLNKQEIEQKLKALIEAKKLTTGEVLWPLRVALTGLEASPGPFEIVEAMAVLPKGKELVLQRINAAIEKIS
ncbi:MAG TPA: glutamate--tRNA ligase, partial [Patescibacteria group bacterium]|nr:glutamate--tRNA ligase [Patescibacteria group bacterium]